MNLMVQYIDIVILSKIKFIFDFVNSPITFSSSELKKVKLVPDGR